ncbi:MAG: ATP synthase F1 subunit epsilon [Oscillospiraceae bacterium]|nr:ATP synthase F1 subunit epsilon [Oscillospiraceae bacterium]
MNTFLLQIITPDRTLFEGQAVQLTARTTEGDVGILAGHTRYAAILKTGALMVKLESGEVKTAAVAGGVVKVSDEKTTVITTAAEWAEEIDPDWAERSRQDAMAKLEASKNEPQRYERANLKLQRALNRLRVYKSKKQA